MPTVRLNWTDPNAAESGHRVYRATSPMNPAALPSPLTTLAANITTYDDTTASASTTYYYRISAYAGTYEKVSTEVSITTPA